MISGLCNLSVAQTIDIEPKGIYKEIDLDRHNNVIQILNGNDTKLKQQTIDSILKNNNLYNPPVLYVLSNELFKQDKKDDAMFWFYTAQLRARYDANLCMDNSAKRAVSVFNAEYGPEINTYAFKDIDKLEKTVLKVIDFVKTNEENYDHRWINLHGMDAVISSTEQNAEKKELSQPKEKWTEIKMKTLDDYRSGFFEHVKKQKK
jgi:hypothetical protein